MLNSINPYNPINGVQYQNNVPNAPVQVSNNSIQQVENPNLNGINALANYNQPINNTPKILAKTPMTIAKPTDIQNIQGEKVTSQDGTLQAIVNKGETTTTVYKTNGDKGVENIKTYDNATGRLIKKEGWFYENEEKERNFEPEAGYVDEFDPQTGNQIKSTYQDFIKPEHSSVTETETLPDGSKKISHVDDTKYSFIAEDAPNGDKMKTTRFKNGQIAEVVTFKDDVEDQIIAYKNGIPVKIENQRTSTTYAPELAQIPTNDPNITPAQPFVLGYNPTEVQGEKKYYYSNGKIQSIETRTANGKVAHRFDVRGNLTEIQSNENGVEKHVVFNNDGAGKVSHSVIENLDKDTKKETTFYADGTKSVHVNNNATKAHTSANYDKDGNLRGYTKYNSENQNEEHLFIDFDTKGNVVYASFL